eukprot:14784271-Alexandrium_andersonii.AAC.1
MAVGAARQPRSSSAGHRPPFPRMMFAVLGRVLLGRRRCHAAAQQLDKALTSAPPQDARSFGVLSGCSHDSRPAEKAAGAKLS